MDYLQYVQFPAAIDTATPLSGYGSINYKVDLVNGATYLVKVYQAKEAKMIQEEERIIDLLQDHLSVRLPASIAMPIADGQPTDIFFRVMRFIEGDMLSLNNVTDELLANIARQAATMAKAAFLIESDIVKAHEHDWNLRDAFRVAPKSEYITDPSSRKIVDHYFALFQQEVLPQFAQLRQGVIHGDLNEANIIVHNGQLSGFIDFGDMSYAPMVGELAVLLTYVMMLFPEDCFSKAEILIRNFNEVWPLTEAEVLVLPKLVATRLCVSVCKSAEAKAKNIDTDYILISEQPAWHLLQKWVALNPLFIEHRFRQSAGMASILPASQQLLLRRKNLALPSLSLSYPTPIHMQTALFQYMFDAQGNTYLDAYNNIPHVGHCHPAVVAAGAEQMKRLNTNTRYLYDMYADYSEKLLSLFPAALHKAALVNSGSEASDLAIRMAKTIKQCDGVAIIEWSYHGNTQNGINISAYKFDRKGGKGADTNILRLPLPKAYKGLYDSAEAYFEDAKKRIEAFEDSGNKLAAFIAEPISGCGGQVPLMPGYLSLLVPYLKAKGVIVIIDEVQTGFGRLGHFFWGFEMHGIIPDMVVLGKPIANGHPMGAVVTTDKLATAFDNGMEFFSSFGGNPVSCAIGNAVIDTIRKEGLQANAKLVGDYWKTQLLQLQNQYPNLGDVRGEGLFVGVECIDEAGKENIALAQFLKNELKENFILASTDGPLDNVLKMKPALCFSTQNVDRFIEVMDESLKKRF